MRKVSKSAGTGFTMIEVMVVVVIIGVLTLVAYPSYQGFVAKGNRAEAQNYLSQIAQQQQLYFRDARRYATSATELNVNEPDRVTNNYVVMFTVATILPPAFAVTATPAAGGKQVDDGILTIDNTGARTLAGKPW